MTQEHLPNYRLDEMPKCPVCGVKPEASWKQINTLGGVNYEGFGVSHPCDCAYPEHDSPEATLRSLVYHKGVARARMAFIHRAAYLSSLPDKYAESAVRGYANEDAFRVGSENFDGFLDALERETGVIYLYGDAGGGKTTLATHLALSHIKKTGLPSVFLNDVSLKNYMFKTFGDKTLPPVEYAKYGSAVLDDLGKSQPTPYYSEYIYALVEHYTSHGKLLIVPTQYAPEELETRLGLEPKTLEALMSRLTSGLILHWDEPDHRLESATPVAQGDY